MKRCSSFTNQTNFLYNVLFAFFVHTSPLLLALCRQVAYILRTKPTRPMTFARRKLLYQLLQPSITMSRVSTENGSATDTTCPSRHTPEIRITPPGNETLISKTPPPYVLSNSPFTLTYGPGRRCARCPVCEEPILGPSEVFEPDNTKSVTHTFCAHTYHVGCFERRCHEGQSANPCFQCDKQHHNSAERVSFAAHTGDTASPNDANLGVNVKDFALEISHPAVQRNHSTDQGQKESSDWGWAKRSISKPSPARRRGQEAGDRLHRLPQDRHFTEKKRRWHFLHKTKKLSSRHHSARLRSRQPSDTLHQLDLERSRDIPEAKRRRFSLQADKEPFSMPHAATFRDQEPSDKVHRLDPEQGHSVFEKKRHWPCKQYFLCKTMGLALLVVAFGVTIVVLGIHKHKQL